MRLELLSISAGLLLTLANLSCTKDHGIPVINDKDSKDSSKDDDEEEEPAGEPSMVTGAFLVCAYMDSEEAVLSHMADQDYKINIGCGLYRTETKVDDSQLDYSWFTQSGTQTCDIGSGDCDVQLGPGNHHFAATLTVPSYRIAETIVVRVDDKNSDKFAIRQKSIQSIQSYGAAQNFEIQKEHERSTDFAEAAALAGASNPNQRQTPVQQSTLCGKILVLTLGSPPAWLVQLCQQFISGFTGAREPIFMGAPPRRHPPQHRYRSNPAQRKGPVFDPREFDEIDYDPYNPKVPDPPAKQPDPPAPDPLPPTPTDDAGSDGGAAPDPFDATGDATEDATEGSGEGGDNADANTSSGSSERDADREEEGG